MRIEGLCWRVLVTVVVLAGSEVIFPVRAGDAFRLESPDGGVRMTVEMPGVGTSDVPVWSATFRGKLLLTRCALGLETAGGGGLLVGARVSGVWRRSVDERVPILFGRADHANDRFNEIRFRFEAPERGPAEVVFRCYDDAVALRYEVLVAQGESSVSVTRESTSFQLAGNPVAFVQELEHFRTSHEHNVRPLPYGDIRADVLLDLPLTFSWADGTTVAITEAALRRYAGMSLQRHTRPDTEGELVCQLTPRPDGIKVVAPLPMKTPWRVALIGDRPGALLESGTIYCLNEPAVIGDVSWIQPGKITWPWWNGDVYDGKPGLPILSLEMARRYIDFCARHGIAAHSLTSTETTVTPWYQQSKPGVEPGPDTDVTRPRAGFDLPAIRGYAESRGVRLWTWAHQGALRGRVDEAFAAFAAMGWSGVMVDFFDHDDQETVEFAESILAAAARHQILVHFHGAWKPTGWERTYPNLMNHEGALNLEYLKWSDRCTPVHNLRMAFTRLIAGPMDYHLGGFRAVSAAEFEARNVAPNVLGTRGHMLAMYVCFDNPVPMVADYPLAYEGQPGLEFISRVPTWWDETRVLAAEVGELLVTARRKGDVWYLGGLSAVRSRDLTLSLSFLGPGTYRARVWRDGPEVAADPNQLVRESMRVAATDRLDVAVASGGGFVAELVPGEPARATEEGMAALAEGLASHDRALHVKDGWMRDPYIYLASDGQYYLTGTTSNPGDPREASEPYNSGLDMPAITGSRRPSIVGSSLRVWRSSDLLRWEDLGVRFTMDQGYWAEVMPERFQTVPREEWRLWAPEVYFLDGKWMFVHTSPSPVQGGANLAVAQGEGLSAPFVHPLKEAMRRRHDPSLFRDTDGRYYLLWGNTFIAPLEKGFSGFVSDPVRIDPEDRRIGHEGATLRKIGGKYVHFGTAWSTDQPRKGTYNLYYCTAEHPLGPYGPRRFAGRFLGHGTPFQDRQGRWWCTAFFNANVPPVSREEALLPSVGGNAHTINPQGVTLVPLDVRVLADGEVWIRAKDPAYANPGPEEVQPFERVILGSGG